jgi:hypothetical protein
MYICKCGRKFKTSQGLGKHKKYCENYEEFLDNGYKCKIGNDGNIIYIHREVLEQKIGRKLKPGELSHHKDDNKLNNDPDNLELTSHSKHAKHHYKKIDQTNNKHVRGSDHPNSKLTEKEVKEIKLKLKEGVLQKTLCLKYNVSKNIISSIYKERTWKHITI